MNIVMSIVNIIESRSLNQGQFRELLIDIEANYGNVIYHSEVRWLSRGKVLKGIYDLRKEVQVFMNMKGKPLLEFSDEDWISDFAFLVDMTQHLNDLNLQLQGRNQLVNDIQYSPMLQSLK
jgi:predicted XRE-type DNA-binding protein